MIYNYKVKDTNGEMASLDEYKGKVLLVVNTATGCGFTPQYEGLQKLYDKYKDRGFEILDFPCNQFFNQAPGDDEEIKSFCTLNYGTTFRRFSKIDVNGEGADPVYKYLRTEAPEADEDDKSKELYDFLSSKGFNTSGDEANNKITLKDVEEVISIGRYSPFERIDNLDKGEVGHVYGLGVSGFLGSTIEIESTVFPAKKKGHGTIKFNDTAGSMAKDSVFNAASVIRKITNMDINDYDIHVNVIGGGKIDGPSAGAAITVCIISALTDRPIRQDIAITGEISLRGNVKPVGGIFEKIYGARRKGIKLVAIPKDNEKEVPLGLEDIEVKSINHIEELMEIVFEK